MSGARRPRGTRACRQPRRSRARISRRDRRVRRSARGTCAIISSTIWRDDERAGLELFYRYAARSRCGAGRARAAVLLMSHRSHCGRKCAAGGRVDAAEALDLYRHAPTPLLGRLADAIRARKHPDGIVTYIIDRNVNYTNVCVARCNFCAFYRPVGIARRLRAGVRRAVSEDRRDHRRRRRAAAAAGRPQSRPAARRGTKICSAPSRSGIPSSSCTRCRRRRSSTSRGSRSCRCRR